MTDKQRDLIADNIKVIYKSLLDNKISDEDDIGDALLYICCHIDDYDENESNFSTFIYMLINYMIKEKQRFNQRDKRKLNYINKYSLEYEFEDGSKLKEKITEPNNIQCNAEMNDIINYYKNKMTDKELIVFDKLLEGKTQTIIANELKCTQQNVSYIIQKLKKKIERRMIR